VNAHFLPGRGENGENMKPEERGGRRGKKKLEEKGEKKKHRTGHSGGVGN